MVGVNFFIKESIMDMKKVVEKKIVIIIGIIIFMPLFSLSFAIFLDYFKLLELNVFLFYGVAFVAYFLGLFIIVNNKEFENKFFQITMKLLMIISFSAIYLLYILILFMGLALYAFICHPWDASMMQ